MDIDTFDIALYDDLCEGFIRASVKDLASPKFHYWIFYWELKRLAYTKKFIGQFWETYDTLVDQYESLAKCENDVFGDFYYYDIEIAYDLLNCFLSL